MHRQAARYAMKDDMTVKIYGSPASRLTRVTWMCEEAGLPYKIVPAKPHSKQLYALNPAGKGPVLQDGDAVIVDSAAICLYLADKHAKQSPDDHFSAEPGTAERGVLDSWMHFAQLDLEAPLWLKLKHKFLLVEELRADVSPVANHEFALAVKAMDARLGDGEFALGNRFTCADILLGHTGQWARGGKFPIESQRVNAYLDRVLSRPALAKAKEREAQAKEAMSG